MIAKHIDVPKFCASLGISRPTLERWLRDPDVKMPRPIRIGRKRYWPEHEINAFLEKNRMAA
ncbi:helix-turn-helix transcriptional regulator [Paracoccus sp. KR1-242]|uniref:helix-turn-helix transcriptional regulator n=1 Tax=Paracoccus sp. KR1-242 TaxID=3410028 RepID=UPI003C028246